MRIETTIKDKTSTYGDIALGLSDECREGFVEIRLGSAKGIVSLDELYQMVCAFNNNPATCSKSDE